MPVCAYCAGANCRSVCKACHSAHYCSPKCQTDDWATYHKLACMRWRYKERFYGDVIEDLGATCVKSMELSLPMLGDFFYAITGSKHDGVKLTFIVPDDLVLARHALLQSFYVWMQTKVFIAAASPTTEDEALRKFSLVNLVENATLMVGINDHPSLKLSLLKPSESLAEAHLVAKGADREKFAAARKGKVALFLELSLSDLRFSGTRYRHAMIIERATPIPNK